jgi:hypothetical protein
MSQTNSFYFKDELHCLFRTDQWWNKPIRQAKRIIVPTGPKHLLVSKSTSQLECGMAVGCPVFLIDNNHEYEVKKITALHRHII